MSTAWRCAREAVALPTATGDTLDTAMTRIRALACAILAGTMILIDRIAKSEAALFGHHRRHGGNVQVIAYPPGRLGWASAALPGSTHDLTAARTRRIIDALNSANMMTFADRRTKDTDSSDWTPFKRHR